MKKIVYTLLIGLTFTLGGCFRPSCIHGDHHVVSESRSTRTFDKLIVSGSFDVYVMYDSVYEVSVEAEENILRYVETNFSGSTLNVRMHSHLECLKENDPIVIYIRTPELSLIRQDGSGSIDCSLIIGNELNIELSGSGTIKSDVDVSYLNASISGSGSIDLTGYIHEADLEVSGSGSIKSGSANYDTCYSKISGSGKIYANVKSLLNVDISGSGDVYYSGNPSLSYKITGSGSVIKNN